jgi:hypothetical protein
MNLGALIAKINQFYEIWIEPCSPDCALKQRFVRAVAAPGDDHAIQPLGNDEVLHMRQAIGQAGQIDHFRVSHTRPRSRFAHNLL